jgi:hypothetical protein
MIILSRLSSPSPSAKGSTSNADRRSRWALLAKPAIGVALAMGVFTAGQAQAMVVNLSEQDWELITFTGTYNENTIYAIINNSVAPPTSDNAAPVVSGDLNQPETYIYILRDQDLGGCPAEFESCPSSTSTVRWWNSPNSYLQFCTLIMGNSINWCKNATFIIPTLPLATTPLTAGSLNISTFMVVTFSTSSSTPVPGPLPALGAAAAFSFSRKLRKRIKRSSDAVSSSYSL